MSTEELECRRDTEEKNILGWLYDVSTQDASVNLTSCRLEFKLLEPTFQTTLAGSDDGSRESNPDAFIESHDATRPNLVVEVKLGIYSENDFRKQFNEHNNIGPVNFRACATSAYDLVYLAKHTVLERVSGLLAPRIASSSGRRVVLWRLVPGERIELFDPSKPNHTDSDLNKLLGHGLILSRHPRTPILFLRRSPIHVKAQAILTQLFASGIATKSAAFSVDDIRQAILPTELEEDEIRRILGFCKDVELIEWKGRDDFSLKVVYGNMLSTSTFFQNIQDLRSLAKTKRADVTQRGLEKYLKTG
jgi:hypothetical protein